MYTEDTKKKVWEKGIIDPRYPKDKVRKDACGAWIIWTEFGKKESPFGWEIDHIYPEALYRLHNATDEKNINDLTNLRPLHWKNNKSKGAHYPTYQAAVKADGDKNVDYTSTFEVNSEVQDLLKKLLHV